MFKKKHFSVDSENLAVPEVHVDSEKQDELVDEDDQLDIDYENKAIPEIRIHKK